MDFIDTDDEINYTEEDVLKLCKDYKDYLDIEEVILRREKKERRKFYEKETLSNLITDVEIGKRIIEKYDLAEKTNTPIEFIYEDENNNFYSIKDKLKNNENILEALSFFKTEHNINLNNFLLCYYISNSFKNKNFLITQLNKLSKITKINYVENEWTEKKNRFNIILEDKMKITKEKCQKIKTFYQEINDLPFSNNPKNINESLILDKTKIEISVRKEKYLFDIDSGSILFDEIRLNKNFPYMQYNSFEEKYYKFYDKDINIQNIINEKNIAFDNLDEDETEKENTIYILNRIEIFNKAQYILLIFNLETSKLTFEYPSKTSFKIYEDLKNLIPGIFFKEEKTISIKGSFEMKIDNYKDLNLYYLTLFDKKIGNFIYVNESKRPRSLMKNVKYYYKTYEENYLESDYFITFHLEQDYINRYIVNFRSKIINQENNINEFALVFSKLINYYEKYNFKETDLPIITNPYTGENGDGLGDDLTEIDLESSFNIKGKKITNLRNRAPEIFPPSEYGRKCGCPEQPIIIDPEDVEDWEKYVGEKAVSVFPPPGSMDKVKKRHIFVCPTDNAIMNYIINPDNESPFPILPCCSKQKKSNYYENYDEIKRDPENFFNIKEVQKTNISKSKLKTIKPLALNQEGNLPESLNQFLNNIYPNSEFTRFGVIKNSKSAFFHCCLLASNHLENLKSYIKDERYLKNIKNLIKIRNLYINQDSGEKDLLITQLKSYISDGKGIKINKELLSQELYNYDSDFINYTLENEVFESNIFYRLMEYLFCVNVFVFLFDDNNIQLEKPRHLYYHQREVRENLDSILIFKHVNTKPATYELIKIKRGDEEGFLLNNKTAKYMKNYIEEKGYYISRFLLGNYNVTKNFYSNINWNFILKDYEILGQFINDSGRTYALNFKTKDENITIFISNTFPLDLPKASRIYKTEKKTAKKLFGNNYTLGSEGYWYELNKTPNSVFIPLSDVKESQENICHDYVITDKKSSQRLNFKILNTVKRNANIITQIILWIWNITPTKNSNLFEDLDEWFDTYIAIGDKKVINSINNSKININYRFPLDITTPEDAIEYYSEYIPSIFGKNQIFLYDELEKSIYQYIKNYIFKTEGYGKIPNKAIIGIFNSELDFNKKPNNKLIIGEKVFDEWINFIENINRDTTILDDSYINQKRGFLYKSKNGHIFLIQNNINESLKVSLLISKIWKNLKINLGYYTTMVNVWQSILNNDKIKEVLNLTDEKIIELANKYITKFENKISTFKEAIDYLQKENIEYELNEDDFNYITTNYEEYINKEYFIDSDPYNLFSYEKGAFASMLNII